MSTSAAHAATFYREVLTAGSVWAVRDQDGFPAPPAEGDARVQPFWSRQSRAERIVATVDAFRGMDIIEIPLADWRGRWLPGLDRDQFLVGLNWSGDRATGYDIRPAEVERNLAAHEAVHPS